MQSALFLLLQVTSFAFFASWREILYWFAVSENAVAQQIVDAAYRVHTTLARIVN